jgi:hypothetical protein
MALAPTNEVSSFFMMSVYESPFSPQEWQFHTCLSVFTDRDGVLSSWRGHRVM